MTKTKITTAEGFRLGMRPLGLGLLHSACMLAAFPPFGLWGFALLAVIPAAFAAVGAGGRPKKTALWFTLGTLAFWGWSQRWVLDVSAAGFWPMIAYLGLTSGLGVWFMARLIRSGRVGMPLAVALGWMTAEMLRGEIFWNGYPWYLVGHPMIDAPYFSGIGAILGAYGMSLVVAMLAGVVLLAVLRGPRPARRHAMSLAIGAVILGGIGSAGTRETSGDTRTARVGLITTNVPQSVRDGWPPVERVRTLATLSSLSREAAEQDADLIVWPETMFPGISPQPEVSDEIRRSGLAWSLTAGELAEIEAMDDLDPRFVASLQRAPDGALLPLELFDSAVRQIIDGVGVPVFVGSPAFTGYQVSQGTGGRVDVTWDARTNSVFLFGAGERPRYDKVRLTPFGEVMPYISAWPWLESQLLAIGAQGMTFDLDAGSERTRFDVQTESGTVGIVTPVCFEATMAHHVRNLVHGSDAPVDLVVQLTNDGWFGDAEGGRLTHLLCARWRALENGVPLVRAANTGVSAAVDRAGRVTAIGEAHAESLLVHRVELATPAPTIYARLGWAIPWLAAIAALVLAILPKKKPDAEGESA